MSVGFGVGVGCRASRLTESRSRSRLHSRVRSRLSEGVGVGLVGADHLDRAALFAVRPHRALAVQSCRARDAQFRDLRAGTRGGGNDDTREQIKNEVSDRSQTDIRIRRREFNS